MRIIGGLYGGRQIALDAKMTFRPTTDFAKEGLFNVLSNRYDVTSLDVLDLFSGSGSISYEFASRGCKLIHAVEIETRQVSAIRRNIKNLNLTQIKVIRDDVFHFLTICKFRYDIIFADPPYNMRDIDKIPAIMLSLDILKPEGVFILEHSRRNNFSEHGMMFDHRHYGNVHFSFFGAKR